MSSINLISAYTRLSGARIEGQLENPRDRQRRLHVLHDAVKSAAESLIAISHTDSHIQAQIALTLTSIRYLISSLSPSSLLASERAVSDQGISDAVRLKPAGLTLVIAEEWAPVSTTIMPVAAALAAGCQCLIIAPPLMDRSRKFDPIWEILERNVLQQAMDDSHFAVHSANDLNRRDLQNGNDPKFHFDIAVSQGTSYANELLRQLIDSRPIGLRVIEPCQGGTAAVVIDRSYEGSLSSLSSEIQDTVTFPGSGKKVNNLRVPMLVFVDEFLVEKFMEEMENYSKEIQKKSETRRVEKSTPGTSRVVRLKGACGKSVEVGQTKTAISSTSERENTIFIVSTSSLDDAIDHLNSLNRGAEAPIAYLFAKSAEAAYLSQFINAQQHVINRIPPATQVINCPSDMYGFSGSNGGGAIDKDYLGLPYSISQFSKHRPVYNSINEDSVLLISSSRIGRDFHRQVAIKLAGVKQSNGGQMSYFIQGLLVSVALIVLPTVASVCYFGWKLVSRFMF